MRLMFAGTPEVAVPSLRALHAAGHELALVLTREDAPRGRKRVMTPSDVALAATELGLPLCKANRIDERVAAQLAAADAELGVVVAYGALLKPTVLTIPPRGWINLHFSLLPAWRGAAPVQHSLLAGGPTGVTVFQLEPGMDTGPIWEQAEYPVSHTATAGEVLGDFAVRGAELLCRAVEVISDGRRAPIPQHGVPTLAPKLGLDDGILNPNDGLAAVLARYRAVTPEPGARILLAADGGAPAADWLKVLVAAPDPTVMASGVFEAVPHGVRWGTGDGSLLLLRVQQAGKAAMSAADWWRGRR